MKEPTKKYIEKKLRLFGAVDSFGYGHDHDGYVYDSDALSSILEKAVGKLSQKKGWSFTEFFSDAEDWSQSNVRLSDSFPIDVTAKYGEKAERGLYVHMFNRDISLESFEDFLAIKGDVCFSDIGDDLMSVRRSKLGVIMDGTPRIRFNCDCWSITKDDGTRYATRGESYSERSELWMAPVSAKVEMVIYCDNTYHMAKKIAARFSAGMVHYDIINSRYETAA